MSKDGKRLPLLMPIFLGIIIAFGHARVFGVPLAIAGFAFVFTVYFIKYNNSFTNFFIGDGIKKLLSIMFLVTIIIYIYNIKNEEIIINTYYLTSGNSPDNLYIKMIVSGVLMLLMIMFAYNYGNSLYIKSGQLLQIINIIVNSVLIVSIINIFSWYTQTGGIIGRYNFNMPFQASYGVACLWSALAFILQVSIVDDKKLNFNTAFKLLVLTINSLIIVSRQVQVMFLFMIVLYILFTRKRKLKIKPIIIAGLMIVGIMGTVFIKYDYSFLDTYSMIINYDSTDYSVRFTGISSALDIFYNNKIFGVGYGFYAGFNVVPVIISRSIVYMGSAHNGFFSVLAEMGITGVAIYLSLLLLIVRRIFKLERLKVPDKRISNIASAMLSIVITLGLSSFISNSAFFPPPLDYSYYGITFILWLLIGAMLSLYNNGLGKNLVACEVV